MMRGADSRLKVRNANHRRIETGNRDEIEHEIKDGKTGTPMPPFASLVTHAFLCIASWGVWLIPTIIGLKTGGPLSLFCTAVGHTGPFAAAVATSYLFKRKSESSMRDLGERIFPSGFNVAHLLVPCLSAWIAILPTSIGGLFAYSTLREASWTHLVLEALAPSLLPASFGALSPYVLFVKGSIQDLGWRGLSYPLLLQTGLNRIVATLVLSLFMWLWKLPIVVLRPTGCHIEFSLAEYCCFALVILPMNLYQSVVWHQSGGFAFLCCFTNSLALIVIDLSSELLTGISKVEVLVCLACSLSLVGAWSAFALSRPEVLLGADTPAEMKPRERTMKDNKH